MGRYFAAHDLSLLYCVCHYPTLKDDIDLSRMLLLKNYAPKVGFSSHYQGIAPAIAALDLGAAVVEQHVVLDRRQSGCDVSSSINFKELETLCAAAKNRPVLVPVVAAEQVEWLRVQRSRPELYKYFRQDAPLSVEQQGKWWRTLDRNRVRLFLVEIGGQRVGYVGFNPFAQGALRAEFGIFIIPEHQGKGYGEVSLKALLKKGFEEYRLSTIYSDVLDYPGENRFDFYKNLGFAAFPAEHQNINYRKQGKTVPSIKFFMTADMWRGNGQDRNPGLEPVRQKAAV